MHGSPSVLSLLCHRRDRSLAEDSLHWASPMLPGEELGITHVTRAWPPVVITVKKTACSRQPLAVV